MKASKILMVFGKITIKTIIYHNKFTVRYTSKKTELWFKKVIT